MIHAISAAERVVQDHGLLLVRRVWAAAALARATEQAVYLRACRWAPGDSNPEPAD
jgi:hypothetical protein